MNSPLPTSLPPSPVDLPKTISNLLLVDLATVQDGLLALPIDRLAESESALIICPHNWCCHVYTAL